MHNIAVHPSWFFFERHDGVNITMNMRVAMCLGGGGVGGHLPSDVLGPLYKAVCYL